MHYIKTVFIFAKAFPSESLASVHEAKVLDDGSVHVYEPVTGIYTPSHILSSEDVQRIQDADRMATI